MIKKFNEGFRSDQYEKLEVIDWKPEGAEILSGLSKKENFSKNALHFIYNLFKRYSIDIKGSSIYVRRGGEGNLQILSYEDEWYLVCVSDDNSNSRFVWYKCDQDDQLQSLLTLIHKKYYK
jgi:hypothetical protein